MEVLGAEVNVDATNVTLTLTTEKAVIVSPLLTQERASATYLIKAWAQVTTGTNITGMSAKIRRGTTISGTQVNETNIITVGAAAGSNEVFTAWAMDTQTEISQAQYVFCLLQVAADGNGTVLQSGIEVTQLG
jgi:hypothetical protein